MTESAAPAPRFSLKIVKKMKNGFPKRNESMAKRKGEHPLPPGVFSWPLILSLSKDAREKCRYTPSFFSAAAMMSLVMSIMSGLTEMEVAPHSTSFSVISG